MLLLTPGKWLFVHTSLSSIEEEGGRNYRPSTNAVHTTLTPGNFGEQCHCQVYLALIANVALNSREVVVRTYVAVQY